MLHTLYLFVSFSVHKKLFNFRIPCLSFRDNSREFNLVGFFVKFPWFLAGLENRYANVPIKPVESPNFAARHFTNIFQSRTIKATTFKHILYVQVVYTQNFREKLVFYRNFKNISLLFSFVTQHLPHPYHTRDVKLNFHAFVMQTNCRDHIRKRICLDSRTVIFDFQTFLLS